MQITFTEQGGVGFFPGLQRPLVIDAESLDIADAAELRRLVAALPADAPTTTPAAPVADGRRYRIVIADGTTTRHVETADPIPDPAVGALVAFLRKQARRVRRMGH